MAKYKTEVGPVMEGLHYQQQEVEDWDALAFRLYCLPSSEMHEHLALLMWQLNGSFFWDKDYPKDYYKKLFKQFDRIFAEHNK